MIQLNQTEVVALMDFYGGMISQLQNRCDGDNGAQLDACLRDITWINNRLHEIENEIN